jgi:hypothetical protein
MSASVNKLANLIIPVADEDHPCSGSATPKATS